MNEPTPNPLPTREGESSVRVETYSSFAYAVEPRAFEYQGVQHRVVQVKRVWRTPGQLHFYVAADDARLFELTYDEPNDRWSIRAFGENCPIPSSTDNL